MIKQYGNGKTYDWDVRKRVVGRAEIAGKVQTFSSRQFIWNAGAATIVESYSISLSPEMYLTKRNEVLKDLFPKTQPMPGARRLTRHLREKCGLVVGVATSSHKSSLDLKLNLHHDWFKEDIKLIVAGISS